MLIIVGATHLELKRLKKFYPNTYELGIGMAKTAYNLLKIIYCNKNKIDKILMLGIGGGYRDKTDLLDICMAEEEINGDFGICYNNGKIEELNNENKIKINPFIKDNWFNFKKGTFITVNCVTTNNKRIEFYQKKYSPICENMEGFVAAYICKKEKIDFSEVRVISNFVGERKNWKTKEAVDILYETGKNIIKKVT